MELAAALVLLQIIFLQRYAPAAANSEGFEASQTMSIMESSSISTPATCETNVMINLVDIPRGCNTITLNGACQFGDLQLYSTAEWRQPQSGVRYTDGIVYVSQFILSIDGINVTNVSNTYGIEPLTGNVDSTDSTIPTTEGCQTFSTCQEDQVPLQNAFVKTFSTDYNFNIFPSWLRLQDEGTEIVIVRLLTGEIIQNTKTIGDYRCDIDDVDRQSWYLAFILAANLKLDSGTFFVDELCVLLDVCNEGSFHFYLPQNPEIEISIRNLPFFLELKNNFGIEINANTIRFSYDTERDPVRKRATDLTTFWNDHGYIQQGPIINPTFVLNADVSKENELMNISGTADIQFELPGIHQIIRGFGVDLWNIYATLYLDDTSELKYELLGRLRKIPLDNIAPDGLSVYASIGGTDDRIWCGENANPPGIHVTTKTSTSPFSDVAELNKTVIDQDALFHLFWTTKINSRLNTLVQIDIETNINDLLELIENMMAFVSQISSITGTIASDISAVSSNLLLMKNEIEVYKNSVSKEEPTIVDQFIDDLWTYFRDLEISVHKIVVTAFENDQYKPFAEIIDSDMREVRGILEMVNDMITEQVLNGIPDYTNFAFKFTASFVIFDLDFPNIIAVFAYSTATDNQYCDKYQNTELLPGQPAARLQGTFSSDQNLGLFFKVKQYSTIQSAFAILSEAIVVTFVTEITFLEINDTAEVTITRTKLAFSLETQIWNLFVTQLEVFATNQGKWFQLTYVVEGHFVGGPGSFQNSLLSELKNAALYVKNEVDRRISLPQQALTISQEILLRSQTITQNRRTVVAEASETLREANSLLESAENRVIEAAGPYNIALANLEAAQIDIERLCKIRTCPLRCIGQVVCGICDRYIFRRQFRCRIVCCSFKCLWYYIDPYCVAYNALCRKCRRRAYVALARAQGFVSIALIDYENEKVARDIAKQRQERAETALERAQNSLEVAENNQLAAEILVNAALQILETVKEMLGSAVNVARYVDDNGLGSIGDVRVSFFNIEISTGDTPVTDVTTTADLFELGDRPFLITVNFAHIQQSLWQAARTIIHRISSDIADKKRKKRDNGALHKRTSRQADEVIDVRNVITGFNGTIITDYDNRVSLFAYKCDQTSVFNSFLQESFQSLFTLANETISLRNVALADTSPSESFDANTLAENLTLDSAGIDTEYAANTFNISMTDLNDALQEAKTEIASDQLLEEINQSIQQSNLNVDEELELVEMFQLIPQWVNAMENSTESYFNETECTKFEDCINYVVGEYFTMMTNEDVPGLENILHALESLEKSIQMLLQNVSIDVQSVYNMSEVILNDIEEIRSLNPFCVEAPTLIVEPQDTSLLEGDTLILTCQANGDPRPSYWWEKDGVLLDVSLSRFVIAGVTVEDSGSYACVAGNYVANITSRQAVISVAARPTTAPPLTTVTTVTSTTTEAPSTTNPPSTSVTTSSSDTTASSTSTSDSPSTSISSITPTPTSTVTEESTTGVTTASAAATGDFPVIPVVVPVTIGVIAILLLVAALIVRYLRKTSTSSTRSHSHNSSLARDFWRPGLRFGPKNSLIARSVASDEQASVKSSEYFRWQNPYGWGDN